MAKLFNAVVLAFLLKILSVQCDQSYLCRISQIEPDSTADTILGQIRTFLTPSYPDLSPPGYYCWWRADSIDQPLQVKCSYSLPEYNYCDETTPDHLEVTANGAIGYFCGSGELAVQPASRIVYVSSKLSSGGKMFCSVTGPTIPQ